jgi:hypothetical protein
MATRAALATRVPVRGEESRLLVVATERRDWDQTERRIHFALLGGIVLATLLATGLALLMVRRIVVMLERVGEQLADLRSDRPIARIGADFPANCGRLPKPSIRACITCMRPLPASAASPATWPTSCARPWQKSASAQKAL